MLLAAALAACVAPARSSGAYEGKAVAAAEVVHSAAESALVVVAALADRKLTGPFASVAVGEAERDAEGAADAFASVQPPDEVSDRLRTQLLAMTDAANDLLAQLRIAVRRFELGALERPFQALGDVSEQLNRFVEEHR